MNCCLSSPERVGRQVRDALARFLQLTQLETQTFTLTGRTIERWRIDAARSVRDTLRQIARNFPGVSAGQANMVYVGVQTQPTVKQDPSGAEQYVVRKLHLVEAHRINSGDDVLIAVINSKIDTGHPDLAGVVAGEYDAAVRRLPARAWYRDGWRDCRTQQAHRCRTES